MLAFVHGGTLFFGKSDTTDRDIGPTSGERSLRAADSLFEENERKAANKHLSVHRYKNGKKQSTMCLRIISGKNESHEPEFCKSDFD